MGLKIELPETLKVVLGEDVEGEGPAAEAISALISLQEQVDDTGKWIAGAIMESSDRLERAIIGLTTAVERLTK